MGRRVSDCSSPSLSPPATLAAVGGYDFSREALWRAGRQRSRRRLWLACTADHPRQGSAAAEPSECSMQQQGSSGGPVDAAQGGRGLCFLQQTVGRLLITPRRGPGSMGARRWTKACTASPGASLTLDPCRWLRARGSHFRTKLGLGHRFVPPTPLRNVQTHSPFYCTPHTPLHCTLHVERSTARTPARRLPLHRPAAFACRPPPQPPACLLDPPQHRTPRLRMSTPASPRNTAEGVLEPDITTSPSL